MSTANNKTVLNVSKSVNLFYANKYIYKMKSNLNII